eukprot:c22918_g2_i1 orf=432-1757(-)
MPQMIEVKLENRIAMGNKIWQDQGVNYLASTLECVGVPSESEGSFPCSSSDGYSSSFSRKYLLSGSSTYGDDGTVCEPEPNSCFNLWKNCRTNHPPTSARWLRKLSTFHRSSIHRSFKSYLDALWSTDSLNHDRLASSTLLSQEKQTWRFFSHDELVLATNNFHPDNVVGKGGFADVYKGSLRDGQHIAIKQLTRADAGQKEIYFLTELGIICHVSHPNTTSLMGICLERGLYLIFKFSPYGNLASVLHGTNIQMLEWAMRYKVAVGIARGLHYLHMGCQRRIIHRDVKASNILLGPQFEPQISDFGLAKWLPDDCTHLMVTPIEGTFGYLAPEYFMHGIVDEKIDVFAFGVVLLELITGRKPIDDSQRSLVIWAKPFLESLNIEQLADPQLAGEYNAKEMQCMVMTAGLCVQQFAVCRPDMGQVLELLTDGALSSNNVDS